MLDLILKRFLDIRRDKLARQYVLETGFGGIWKALAMLLTLVQVPLILGAIGEVNYGIWVTLLSFGNWMQLLDVGMGNGLRNMLALDLGAGTTEQSKKYASTVYAVLFVFTTVFLIVVIPFVQIIPWESVLNIDASTTSADIPLLISLVLVLLGFRFVMRLILSIYAAHGRTSVSNLVPVAANGVGILVLIVARALDYDLDLTDVIIVFGGMPLLVLIVLNILAFSNSYRSIRPSLSAVDLSSTGALMRLSGQFFLTQITALAIYSSVPIVISTLLGPSAVTEFDVANKVFMIPILLTGLLNAPLLPMITRKFGERNIKWIRRTLRKMKYVSWAIVLLTIGLAIVVPFVYDFWLQGQVEVSNMLILTLSIYVCLNVLNHTYSVVINALGRLREAVILGPIGVLLFLTSAWMFTSFIPHISVIPIALALTSLIGLVVFPLVIRKELDGLK